MELLGCACLRHSALHFLPQGLAHVGGDASVHGGQLFAHAVGFGGGQLVHLHALGLQVGQGLVGFSAGVLALKVAALLGGVQQHFCSAFERPSQYFLLTSTIQGL